MKTKTKSQKGLTLIELMIAVAAGAILILAAGIALSIGHTSWNKAWKKASLQRDASYAMLRMSHSIRGGTSAEEQANGKAVKIYGKEGSIRFSHTEGTKNLKCQIEEQPETIISDKLEALQFNVEGSKVTIDLKLKDDDVQTHLVSTVMMRNYGG